MLERNRQLLQTLKEEQSFFESDGYGRSLCGNWRPTLLFRDSPTCINYSSAGMLNPCQQCPLFFLVPSTKRDHAIPCHHITLEPGGNTIALLYQTGSQEVLDQLYRSWLFAVIKGLEQH